MAPLNPQQMIAEAQRLAQAGRLAEAEAILRQLIDRAPNHAELLNQTALLCRQQGKLTEAEELMRRAVSINPASPAYHNNLGAVLAELGHKAEALECFQRVTTLNPRDARAFFNLGGALAQLDRPDEAIAAYERAIEIDPRDAKAINNLAGAFRVQGRVAEAVEQFKKSLAVQPMAQTHSNLVYAMWFDAGATPADILAEHQRWAERWAKPLATGIAPHANDRDPSRRLRIGYVSPDFRQHVIALFMQPILQHRNREGFESICYADVSPPDFMTQRLRADAEGWVRTTSMSDAALAERIRADRIDILVDLTAHMARNRMLAFARKPAPVQVSYLAYAGTTGLPAMDYRFSDPHLDPESAEPFGTERVLRLPETYWCYQPQIEVPDVSPRSGDGPIIFASFNSAAKINPPVIALWSRILLRIPESRLQLIVAGGERGNDHLKRAFALNGVDSKRLVLHDKVNYDAYFPLYADVDIALDPFPYNGGTTTLDALYMGVPVVTLAGSSGMSRAGVSILTNAGLHDLIARASDDYEKIVVELANDRTKLAKLRTELRPRMQASALMDAPRFVRHLEAAYRSIWREYCG
jgi:protein O-GlcNAc transferase